MKAVIFDLDGTLLDVSESVFWQYETLTREFNGVQASREAIAAALNNHPAEQSVRHLITNMRTPFEHVQRRHDQLRAASLKHLVLYPHADELLLLLERLGVRIGVIATDSHDTYQHLERLGLTPYIKSLVTPGQVPAGDDRHKRAVHLTLRDLDVLPHEAVVVGDTAEDILAGKAARVYGTVGIAHGFGTPRELQQAGADHIVHDVPALLDVLG